MKVEPTATAPKVEATAEPTKAEVKPTEPPKSDGSVGTLDDVKSATIQIIAQGTFIDPQVGVMVNAAGSRASLLGKPLQSAGELRFQRLGLGDPTRALRKCFEVAVECVACRLQRSGRSRPDAAPHHRHQKRFPGEIFVAASLLACWRFGLWGLLAPVAILGVTMLREGSLGLWAWWVPACALTGAWMGLREEGEGQQREGGHAGSSVREACTL